MNIISREIFRAYDIRGIVGTQLNTFTVKAIGQAIGSEVLAQGETTIITARDGRLSGAELMQALQEGILASGCNIIDIGMQPTPVLYYATHILQTTSGVMLTGSHNPTNYNGLKTVIAGKTLTTEAIQELYFRVINQDFLTGQGHLSTTDVTERYLQQITQHIKLSRPIKLVIDCGNGATGQIAPSLFEALGCDVTTLYGEIDGNFPNHHPDPSIPENLQTLITTVQETNADVGFAFDGDGDRLGLVTNKGEIIWPDRQMALFAKDILTRHPNSLIIYDVKCSKHLTDIINQHGGVALMYKTGHSLLKNKMQETGALLCGEMSGHIYFKERWFGFDDGMYTGARLLEILTQQTLTCSELFHTIPDSINTPEIKLPMPDDKKFHFMEKLVQSAYFPDDIVNTIDGLRVDFADGWGLIRLSNTTPYLILRFEADDAAGLERIKETFRQLLLKQDQTLVLTF